MRKRLALATAALAMLTTPVLADEPVELTDGEAKLADMLEGRIAGEPQNCIRTIGSRAFTRIDDTALVYESGDTLWGNYTRNPESIDDDDVMVIDKFTATRLCRTDQITLRDRLSGFFSGVLFLGDFVPYTTPDADSL